MKFLIVVALLVGYVASQQPGNGQGLKRVLGCDPNKDLFVGENAEGITSEDLSITIDMLVQRPDYSQTFDISSFQPTPEGPMGTTRMNVEYSYELASKPFDADVAYFGEPCDVASTGKIIFDVDEAGEFRNLGDDDVQQFLDYMLFVYQNMSTTVTLDASGSLNTSYSIDTVIPYELVVSAGLLDASGDIMVCCEMMPTFPEIPDTFSVVVEANILNLGYSFVLHEYYSYELDKVRLDQSIFELDRVLIADYDVALDHVIQMPSPFNDTYPDGVCYDQEFDTFQNLTRGAGGHVVNSTQFLLFTDPSNVRFVELSPPEIVRGVPCETWEYSFEADGTDSFGLNGTFTVSMYFAHAYWRVPRNSEYRQLMRIKLVGEDVGTGSGVDQIYEFVDFKPFILPYVSFDPCSILPDGENCCTED